MVILAVFSGADGALAVGDVGSETPSATTGKAADTGAAGEPAAGGCTVDADADADGFAFSASAVAVVIGGESPEIRERSSLIGDTLSGKSRTKAVPGPGGPAGCGCGTGKIVVGGGSFLTRGMLAHSALISRSRSELAWAACTRYLSTTIR